MEAVIIVLLGAAVAGFVQGLSGFAFGMVAMSFWAWVLDPRLAAALAVVGALSGQLMGVLSVRRGFNWAHLWPFLLGGLVGLPIGVKVLPLLNPQIFRAVLGLILTICCPIMLWSTRLPRCGGGKLADGLAGLAGGVLGGIGGFTGVVPTLWCTLRGFDKDVQRAVIQNFNLAMLTVAFLIYLSTGVVTRDMWPWFAMVIPTLLIPAFFGTRVYIGISAQTFRRVVLGLLTASGCTMLISSLPALLRQAGS